MTINQLFKKKPEKELVVKFLNIYGLHSFEDESYFNKIKLEKLNVVDKLTEFSSELEEYYLPCKFRVYFQNINIKKSITILRQIMKLYEYYVKSTEKYIKGDKIIIYQILPINIKKKILNEDEKCIISFD